MSDTDKLFAELEAQLRSFSARRMPAYLREAVASGCYVYGAGSYGRRIASLLRQNDIACLGMIDRKFDDSVQVVDGVRAIHPESFKTSEAKGHALVIGVHNHVTNLSEIVDFGKTHCFREILWNADLPDVLGPPADNYWLTRRQFTADHFDDFRRAAHRLADEVSLKTLLSLIDYRVTGQISHSLRPNINEQYLPLGLFHFDKPITLVDGGAFDGDTYRHLRSKHIDIAHWVAFEPDPRNFASLAAFAGSQTTKITLFPCGLSQSFMQVSFTENGGTSSHLTSEAGGMTIPCVPLDDVIQGQHVDYIKLDIEGAEKDALLGMTRTIDKCQPYLAVSGYHRPEDLWVIPGALAQLAPYAKLYMRQHSLNAFETVIYAVP